MEFPDLCKHCSWPSCRELDFLPITCSFCKLVFCKDHANKDRHECNFTANVNTDHVSPKTFVCSFNDCNGSSPVEMTCPKCGNHFCLQHRYHSCFEKSQDLLNLEKQAWSAPKQHFDESLNQVNKIVNEGIKKSLLKPKKQEMAQKVQLLRLKGKAKGPNTIPSESRVYFLIVFNKDGKGQVCQPVFTSKDWSVGRVIDSIAETCCIPNNNNKPNSNKLRLFRKLNGFQISSDMTMKISDLINSDCILNGETLIFEYVSPSEDIVNFKLLNYAEFKES